MLMRVAKIEIISTIKILSAQLSAVEITNIKKRGNNKIKLIGKPRPMPNQKLFSLLDFLMSNLLITFSLKNITGR
jgi:hypothetical protein